MREFNCNQTCLRALVVAVAGAAASVTVAQTITVNAALDDYMDFGGAQLVSDLPGPDGLVMLREAVTAANNTPGPQTIVFAIPTSEWSIFFSDRAIIEIDNMIYVSGDDTTIDFSTQTAFTGDTNPNGNEVGIAYFGVPSYIPALWLAADRCTIRGLDVAFGNNFSQTIWITGAENRVVGCTTNGLTIRGDYGSGDFNIIGGTAPGDGNTFSEGVGLFSGASNNVLVGNGFHWGLRINGDTFYGTCDNNRVGGPSAAERNTLAGHGYYAEEGFPSGTQLEIQHAVGTLIENNFVGTTADGAAKYPGWSGTGGISVYTGALNTVIRDNLISGIAMSGTNHYQGQRFGAALGIGSTASGTVLTGNRIGVANDGVAPIPNYHGLVVWSDANGVPGGTQFGATAPSAGNLVAFSEHTGIRIDGSAAGVRISGNSIYGNTLLGIDLFGSGAGVTPNDPGDADAGGNGLQNFPILTTAESSATSTRIAGTLNSLANQAFTLEFFGSPDCDAGGFGEGQTFLGAATLVTGGTGNGTFNVLLPVGVPIGSVVTATASQNATGNTSEFSACVTVAPSAGPAGDLDGDGDVDQADLALLLSCYGVPSDPCGDVDGDGDTDQADLAALLANYGA